MVTELAPALPTVQADSDQLVQVLVNLFANAQQAMAGQPRPRRLTVRSRADAACTSVRVEVQDCGPGIAPEVRARIFDPFFTTKAVGEGTGLGLSVSLGIVQAHEGTLTLADANPGQGACFVLTLPARESGALPHDPSLQRAEAQVSPARVLVVDDEPEIAELIEETLQRAGHQVRVAGSGEEALALLDEAGADAIFTDLKMPCMDGPAFYRELQRRHPHLASRVIAVTGDTLSASAREFVERAGMPVLDKPFALADLLLALRSLLERTRPISGASPAQDTMDRSGR
jgi:CheY-like chemotaxis protein